MEYRPNFLQTPYLLVMDDNLTPADREVYAAIDWFSQLKKGKCTASNETIGTIANKKQGTVANSVSRLAKYKYVSVIINKANQREAIIPLVRYTQLAEESPTIEDTLHQPMNPPSLSDEPYPSLSNEQKENNIKGEYKEKAHQYLGWLEAIPEADLESLHATFSLPYKEIKEEAQKAADWLRAKGQIRKDYRAYLRNWIRNANRFKSERQAAGRPAPRVDEWGFPIN